MYRANEAFSSRAEDVPNHATGDAANGPAHAKDLAAGKLWGWPPEKARVNADNWALMAWGTLHYDSHTESIAL